MGNEDVKRSLVTDNMIIYIDNPKECINKNQYGFDTSKDTKLWGKKVFLYTTSKQ